MKIYTKNVDFSRMFQTTRDKVFACCLAGKVGLITLNTEKVEKNKTRARVTPEILNTNKWFR